MTRLIARTRGFRPDNDSAYFDGTSVEIYPMTDLPEGATNVDEYTTGSH